MSYGIYYKRLHELLVVFQSIENQTLSKVGHIRTYGSLTHVILEFETVSLVIEAIDTDDTITVKILNDQEREELAIKDVSGEDPWPKYLGRYFGWGWVNISQEHDPDGILLSFDGIIPSIMFNVMASSLYLSEIHEVPGQRRDRSGELQGY